MEKFLSRIIDMIPVVTLVYSQSLSLIKKNRKADKELRTESIEKIETYLQTNKKSINPYISGEIRFNSIKAEIEVNCINNSLYIVFIKDVQVSLQEDMDSRYLKMVIDNSQIGLIEFSSDGNVLYCNKYVCQALDIEYEKLKKLNYKKDMKDTDLAKVLKNGEAGIIGEYHGVITSYSGKSINISANIYPIMNGVALSFIDMTGQIEMNEILQNEKLKSNIAKQSKTHFLANVSHEMRTPLNSIIGFIELTIKDSEQNQKCIQYLKRSLDSAIELKMVVDDILDISQMENGKISLHEEAMDIRSIMSGIKELFQIKAEQNGIDFIINMDSNIKRYYLVDSTRFKQILVNLLDNAFKFTAHGKVEVSVWNHEKKGIKISIEDTGTGIKDEYIPRLFESFTQEDTSKSRKYSGLGLGATIAKNLVEAFGGEIELKSQMNVGTIITYTLPINPVPNKINFNVLLGDDSEDNVILSKMHLEQMGWTIITAKDGYELKEKFQAYDIDLIVTDANMPRMTGMQAIQAIRMIEKQNNTEEYLPAILMSADVDGLKNQLHEACDVIRVERKPIDYKRMITFIQDYFLHKKRVILPSEAFFQEMDITNDQATLIDIDLGKKRWITEKAYINGIRIFLNKYNNASQRIHELFSDNKYESLIEYVHRMKGTSGNLCLNKVFETLNSLEIKLNEKEYNSCDIWIAKAQKHIDTSLDALNKYLGEKEMSSVQTKEQSTLKIKKLQKIKAELFKSIESYDYDEIVKWVDEVSNYVESKDMIGINEALDEFDYEELNKKLKDLFNVNIESWKGGV